MITPRETALQRFHSFIIEVAVHRSMLECIRRVVSSLEVTSMPHSRKIRLIGLAAAFGAGWLAKTTAQIPSFPVITYFSREKVDASFVKSATSNGGGVLFSRKDRQGRTWEVHSNTRGKADEGQVHSHEGWTAVVVVMSGAATFVTPGAAATKTAPNVLGGQSIGSGESHRISNGDVIVLPAGAPHVYTNIEEPFRYLVVETPL